MTEADATDEAYLYRHQSPRTFQLCSVLLVLFDH